MISKKCRKCREEKKLEDFPKMTIGKHGRGSTCFSCMKLWQKPQKELKRTEIAKVGKKRTERLKNGGSEVRIHERIYESRKHCEICFTEVKNPQPWSFAHILSKKDYPFLRLFENNFVFVCSIECHAEVDRHLAGKNKKEIQDQILA